MTDLTTLLQFLAAPEAAAALTVTAAVFGFVGLGFLINTKAPAFGELLRALDD